MTMEERTISKELSRGAESRRCDSCKTAAAMVFCRADSAYLCGDCDSEVHTANELASRHERVVICEVCEQAPATVICKADAASLCSTCDSDIHSANPLAHRHVRTPIIPICETIGSKAHLATLPVPRMEDEEKDYTMEEASWVLLNPKTNDQDLKETDCFFYDIDAYLDFDYGTSLAIADRLVPVQNKPYPGSFIYPENELNIDFNYSCEQGFSYTTQSLSHDVSSSSMEIGVVPDAADISKLFEVSSAGIDSMTTTPTAATTAIQISCLDREARVSRYREKKKNRKFRKTIRYASRKAYAETRPRIKGRFAKRTDMDVIVDQIYSGYGVVHSF